MSLKNTSYFNPTSVTGCSLWLDGADTSTASMTLSGSNVSTWKDKSGTGNNASANTGTVTTNSTQINGLNTIRFNTNSYLNIPSFTMAANISAFAVLRGVVAQGSGNGGYFFLGNGAQPSFFVYTLQPQYGNISGPYSAWVASTGETNWYMPSNDFFLNNPGFIYTDNSTSYLNGSQLTFNPNRASVPNSVSAGTYSILVGGRGTDTLGFDFAECIFYNTTLTAARRQQIEGYLAWKWGLTSSLPSSHPYALSPSYGIPSLVANAPAKTTLTYANHPVVAISGCALWFDGTDPLGTGTAPANGTSLTTWANKGTTSVTLAYGTSQPTYSANFQNGLGSVSFNNNYFSAAYSFNLQTKSAFIVCSQSNNATDSPQGILSFYGSGLDTVNSTNGYGYQATQGGYGSFGWLYNIFQGGSTGYYIATGTAGANTPMGIYGNVFSNQFEQTFKDGSSVTNFTISTTPGIATNLMVGARIISGGLRGSFFGNICEIIVYNIALTTAQRQNIEGYLAQKWGLTANLPGAHPFKSSFPLFPAPVTTGVRRIAGRRWSPLTPGGCGLWLDGADSSTITLSSGVITQWRDKSGNGRNTTTIGGSPTFSSNFINLNGSSTYLVGPYTNTTEYLTMFVIATVDFSQGVYAYYYRLLSVGSTSANDYNSPSYASILHNPDSTQIGGYRNFATNFGSVTTNTTFLICLQYDGTNSTNFINGTSASSVASTGSFGTTSYSIGRDVGNTDGGGAYTYWPGKVGEVIIFNSSLSNTQRQQAEGYLAWKWGLKDSLPSSHPYKLFPPSP
jgi:hypothetical protein